MHACIKIAEHEIYAQEISDLSKKDQDSSKNQMQPLHSFLKKEGYFRFGGRLQYSHLPYDSKHQLILPPAHHITELIIMNENLWLLHADPQLMSASLRQQYWIVYVGIVYVNPFEIKRGNTRSKPTTKFYVALLICISTKAIHLELDYYLISEAFIATLKFFIARRELIDHLYSDNGSNFVGANRELKAFFKSEEFLGKLHSYATNKISVAIHSPEFTTFCRTVGSRC